MKSKVLGLVLIFIGLSGAALLGTASKVQEVLKLAPSENRLRWYAQEAKEAGKKKLSIPSLTLDYAGSSSSMNLNRALATYTVVIAEPIGKQTYEFTSNDLITWYKFKIIESLSERKSPVCPLCNSVTPPPELLPLTSDEFLLSKSGGRLLVDGIEIEQIEVGFPEFKDRQRYLLLLSIQPSGAATTAGGPLGVFMVKNDGNFSPINDKHHRLKEDFNEKFSNSVGRLKEHLGRSH